MATTVTRPVMIASPSSQTDLRRHATATFASTSPIRMPRPMAESICSTCVEPKKKSRNAAKYSRAMPAPRK